MAARSARRDIRFIPACAGNTCSGDVVMAMAPVHPRVCGEHLERVNGAEAYVGSSPRVRGTRLPEDRNAVVKRFIPACAGNTGRIFSRFTAMPVHPRVCGEHMSGPKNPEDGVGSSPRVRGTRHSPDPDRVLHRFIPACAGNTRRGHACGRYQAVHPRVCGEHWCTPRLPSGATGSSPRVRGTLQNVLQDTSAQRFIPACAGNTLPGTY